MNKLLLSCIGLSLFVGVTTDCFADEVKIQVNFTANTQYGSFADALYFTEAEWSANPDVEALKQQRVDKWTAYMATASTHKEPTKAQLQAQVVSIDERLAEINTQKTELESKIASMP